MGHVYGRRRDWASLPQELLEKIDEKLGMNGGDYVRFRSGCKSWRGVSPRKLKLLPWLMLPCKDDDTKYGGDFFSQSDNKVYHLPLPEYFGKRCIGSSQGWMCFVEPKDLILTLYNPFTKAHIQLPSFTTLPKLHARVSKKGHREYVWTGAQPKEIYCIEDLLEEIYCIEDLFSKIILSENPTPDSYAAMIRFSGDHRMAFCRSGDTKWCPVKSDPSNPMIHDAIYHQGRFYLLRGDVTVTTFDPCDQNEKSFITAAKLLIPQNIGWATPVTLNLVVEVSGEVVLLLRTSRRPYHDEFIFNTDDHGIIYKTNFFHVYKFIPKLNEWEKVTSLGGHTLFVGTNSSFSLPASQGWKPNNIYFTDRYEFGVRDYKVGGHDAGIFNLEDGNIEPLLLGDAVENHSCFIWPPPMWITPPTILN